MCNVPCVLSHYKWFCVSGGEYSEDDMNELEKEDDDEDHVQEDGGEKASCRNKHKKKNKTSILAR